MNTVFARAVVALTLAALGLVALPSSALASTKASTKHSHSAAKKDGAPKKASKHHSHKSSGNRAVAAHRSKTAPVAAKMVPAAPLSEPTVKAP